MTNPNIKCYECLGPLVRRRRRNSGRKPVRKGKVSKHIIKRDLCHACTVKHRNSSHSAYDSDEFQNQTTSSTNNVADDFQYTTLKEGRDQLGHACTVKQGTTNTDNITHDFEEATHLLGGGSPTKVYSTVHPTPVHESTPHSDMTFHQAGFSNNGNTCYIAASLQMFFHSSPLIAWLHKFTTHRMQCASATCLVCAFLKLHEDYTTGLIVSISEFLKSVEVHIPYVKDGLQHDSHEFMTHLLNSLNNESLKIQEEGLVVEPLIKIFSFTFQGKTRCVKGHLTSTEPCEANQLQLSVQRSIECSIKNHFSEEGVTDVHCDGCGAKVAKLKSYSLLSQPQNLLIQLKRFNAPNLKNKSHTELQQEIEFGGCHYQLVSIIFHHGQNTNEGHYTAACVSMVSGKPTWHMYNDSQVSEVPWSAFHSAEKESESYIFLYEKSKDAPVTPKSRFASGPGTKSRSASCQGSAIQSMMQGSICKVHQVIVESDYVPEGMTPVEFVAKLFQISTKTVRRYVKRGARGSPFRTPGKKRRRIAPKRGVDHFVKASILRLIYDLRRRKKRFNIVSLLKEIKSQGIEFEGSVETLRLVLLDMGFKYRTRNRRRYLMELPNVVKQRIAFVKEYMRLKQEGKHAFKYLDETWIFRYGSFTGSEWIIEGDKKTYSVAQSNNGQRYIILHCGGKDGWVPGAALLFRSKSNDGDYHGEMNGENFETWCKTQLTPNLDGDCVIVLDNASYHKCQLVLSSFNHNTLRATFVVSVFMFSPLLRMKLARAGRK